MCYGIPGERTVHGWGENGRIHENVTDEGVRSVSPLLKEEELVEDVL